MGNHLKVGVRNNDKKGNDKGNNIAPPHRN